MFLWCFYSSFALVPTCSMHMLRCVCRCGHSMLPTQPKCRVRFVHAVHTHMAMPLVLALLRVRWRCRCRIWCIIPDVQFPRRVNLGAVCTHQHLGVAGQLPYQRHALEQRCPWCRPVKTTKLGKHNACGRCMWLLCLAVNVVLEKRGGISDGRVQPHRLSSTVGLHERGARSKRGKRTRLCSVSLAQCLRSKCTHREWLANQVRDSVNLRACQSGLQRVIRVSGASARVPSAVPITSILKCKCVPCCPARLEPSRPIVPCPNTTPA